MVELWDIRDCAVRDVHVLHTHEYLGDNTMTLLPESDADRSKLLVLFVGEIQKTNKIMGRVIGTYQILDMLERLAIENGLVECPHCHQKRGGT